MLPSCLQCSSGRLAQNLLHRLAFSLFGDRARQANALAESASGVALRGGMASIKDSSQRIVDIIGVIDDIAFQSNIVAPARLAIAGR